MGKESKYKSDPYHRNKILKRVAQYRKNNRDKWLSSAKKYRDSHIEEIKESNKKRWAKNKTKYSLLKLKYKYGLTIEDYNNLFNKSGGKCFICGIHQNKLNRPLFVDHNHLTGKIRGLLCRQCNSIIGYSYENCDVLLKTIQYLLEN